MPKCALLGDRLERRRRALPAVLGVGRELPPAGLVELVPRVLERLRDAHLAAFELHALAIADRVDGPEHLRGEAVALVEHHLHFLGAPLREGLLPEEVSEPELLEEQELELSKIGLVAILGLGHR